MNKTSKLLFALVIAAIALLAFDAMAAQHAFQFTLHPDPTWATVQVAGSLPLAIKVELDRIHSEVGTPLREMQAELADLQQRIAAGEINSAGGPPAVSVGFTAVSAFHEDSAFMAASAAAQRGMKLSQFAARINLDGNIRAALISDGGTPSSGHSYPLPPQRGGISLPIQRQLRLLEVLPSRPTTSDAVEYIQLDVDGDVSEQDQQGDEKAHVDFEGTLVRAEIATIAGWTSASKQVLADAPGLQAAIDRVIRNKVFSRLEHQLINGTGDPGKIKGLLANATIFVPAIGQTPADIIGESLVSQADAGYLPGLILLNPLDWYAIQITKSATEEEYVFGSPTMPVPPALWNTPIVVTPSVPQGTGLTLDTSATTVLDREQMTVQISNQHSDFFTRNLVAILGELRAGLEVTDTGAVYKFSIPAASSGS